MIILRAGVHDARRGRFHGYSVSVVMGFSRITTAFTGLRPVDARKAENPPAATPVQRLVMPISMRLIDKIPIAAVMPKGNSALAIYTR
jgi:hypothetical protein